MIADTVERYNRWLIQRHCTDVIVLGNAVTDVPGARHVPISGIDPAFFLLAGQARSNRPYFMGKLIWEKGFRDLIDLPAASDTRDVDVFGVGRDREAIASYARERQVRLHFRGLSKQPPIDLKDYKIFINASKSEGLCTTTAEALGQRKFAIIPKDPSNEPYYSFSNALVYDTPDEFLSCLRYAQDNTPGIDRLEASLSWEAAVDRLLAHHADTAGSGMA